MKILWLCNIVLADFCEEFGFKKNVAGGWMTGMLHELKNKVEIALCFPIINPLCAKDGAIDGHKYYSFQFHKSEYDITVKERFKEIIKDFNPDVVHIWGTEYPHSLAMINACDELGILTKVLLNIQGLVSVYSKHYYTGIPEEYIDLKIEDNSTIRQESEDFAKRGELEEAAIKKVRHIIGRTDWDKACITRLNPSAQYYYCGEILREEFYQNKNTWKYEECEKETIFVSQAHYPIKGLHYLLSAMPDILKSYPNTHINVGGMNPTLPNLNGVITSYGCYIKELIKKYSLEDKITFLGQLSGADMIKQYRCANVFVSASIMENSPNSVCEALVVGTPLVTSFVGGVNNIIENMKNCYCYQHDAEYMLAYYVKKVFSESKFGYNELKIVDKNKNARDTYEIYQLVNTNLS